MDISRQDTYSHGYLKPNDAGCHWMILLRKFIDGVRTTVVVLIIGGTSLFIVPTAYDSFVLPKIAWLEALTLLLLFFTALRWLFLDEGFKIRLHSLNLTLLVYVLLVALSILYAKSKALAVEDTGILLSLFIFALLLQDYAMGKKVRIAVLGWILIVSGLITSIWVLYEDIVSSFYPSASRVVPRLSDWRGFLSAGLGNTNHIADFLALCLLLSLLYFIYVRRKWREGFTFFTLVVIGAGLFVCWSVGSNLGFVAGVVVMVFGLQRLETGGVLQKRFKRLLFILLAGVAICVFFLAPHPLNPHAPSLWTEAFGSPRWHAGGPTRLAIWLNSLHIISRHPIIGVGAGNFTYSYVQEISPLVLNSPSLAPYAGMYTNAAHNIILQAWIEQGIVGVAVLAFLVGSFFLILLQGIQYATRINFLIRLGLIMLMAGLLVQGQMNFVLQLPTTLMLFFALIALAGTLIDKNRFGRGRLIPVQFNKGILSVDIWMERMQRPQILEIKPPRTPVAVRAVFALLLFAVCTVLTVAALRPLAADIVYKKAHIAKHLNRATEAEEYFKTALDIWNNHSDCRSSYTDFLIKHARYKEAIPHLHKVQEKLQAPETYYRLGYAHLQLGNLEQAANYLETYYRRLPRAQHIHPEEFKWLLHYDNNQQ